MLATKFGAIVVPALVSFNPEGSRIWWPLFVELMRGGV